MDLTALRDLLSRYGRSTLPDESILQDALNDSNYGTAFKEWISTHLGTENLLSKDELSLSCNSQEGASSPACLTNTCSCPDVYTGTPSPPLVWKFQ
ncbi:hypothetical protein HYQ46_013350 [Verticillium longisporum]|nr:hypothetical protein HYQ46_013350 [Verticillium longisporum]